jgi:hypothetical protein
LTSVPSGTLSQRIREVANRPYDNPDTAADENIGRRYYQLELQKQRAQKRAAKAHPRPATVRMKPDYQHQLYIKRARAQEEARQKLVHEYNIHKAHKPGGSEYEQARQRFADGYSEERKKAREEYIKSLYAARKKPTGKLKTT